MASTTTVTALLFALLFLPFALFFVPLAFFLPVLLLLLAVFLPLFVGPEMPAPVVQYWRDALKKMVQTKAWKAELEKNQWADTFESDTFRASLDKGNEVYRSLLHQLGLVKK